MCRVGETGWTWATRDNARSSPPPRLGVESVRAAKTTISPQWSADNRPLRSTLRTACIGSARGCQSPREEQDVGCRALLSGTQRSANARRLMRRWNMHRWCGHSNLGRTRDRL